MENVRKITACAVFLLIGLTILTISVYLYFESNWLTSIRMLIPNYSIPEADDINVHRINQVSRKYTTGVSSRLIFNTTVSEFWIPTKELCTKLHLDLDFNITARTSLKNGTRLIVLSDPPGWLKPAINNDTMKLCIYNNCVVSYDRSRISKANAVAFWSNSLGSKPPPRPVGQPWVMMSWENPIHTSKTITKPEWRGEFNWTMTYTLDSDLFAPVGIFAPAKDPRSYQTLLNIVQKKTKTAAWFVSNCKTPSRRMEYVKRLQKIIDVDILGKCGSKTCRSDDPSCLQTLNHRYKFYLSFENAFCEDYITEKLYKTFHLPLIPVVRGGADYKNLVPRGTYVNAADFNSPEKLGWYLKYLSNDPSAYMDILVKKEQYRTMNAVKGKQMAFCELCYRLNNPTVKRNVHEDVGEWLRNEKCHPPFDLGPP